MCWLGSLAWSLDRWRCWRVGSPRWNLAWASALPPPRSAVAAGAFLYCGQAPFGLGLGGANTATLSSSVEPVAGSAFSFELSNFNGSGNAFLVISMQSANLPAFGGTLLADIGQSIFGAGNFAMVPVVGGMGQYGVSIPPAAAGVSVYGLAAMFDAGQPAGIALSNGLQVTVCP